MGPVPSDRLKNHNEVDTRSSLSLCLSANGMSITRELVCYLVSRDGSKINSFFNLQKRIYLG